MALSANAGALNSAGGAGVASSASWQLMAWQWQRIWRNSWRSLQ
jgi:hypothetical protein